MNNRILINRTSDTEYDGTISFGRGIKLTSGQTITIPINNTISTIYKVVDGSPYFEEGPQDISDYTIDKVAVHSNYIFYKGIFTQDQKDYLESKPETFLYMQDGLVKSNILTDSELTNICNWLPLVDADACVRDYVNYSEGVENTDVDGLYVGGGTSGPNAVNSFEKIGDHTATLHVEEHPSRTYEPEFILFTTGYAEDLLYKFTFNCVVTRGVYNTRGVTVNTDKAPDILSGHKYLSIGEYSCQFVGNFTSSGRYGTATNSGASETADCDFSVKMSAIKLAGIYRIVNYTDDVNVSNLTYGIQTCFWEIDDLGLVTGLANGISTKNEPNGIIDTAYTPDGKSVIEQVVTENGQVNHYAFDTNLDIYKNGEITGKYKLPNGTLSIGVNAINKTVDGYKKFTVTKENPHTLYQKWLKTFYPDNVYPLPPMSEWYDITKYPGVVADGITDDSMVMATLAADKSITNWYIPRGKRIRFSKAGPFSHVNAIFGGGTMISAIIPDQTYPEPSLRMGERDTPLVIDGIKFEYEMGSYTPPHGDYGAIFFDAHTLISNVEIRNCTFDGSTSTDRPMNAIRISSSNLGGYKKNIYIHDNSFINTQRFGIEIFGYDDRTETQTENIQIYNNIFDNSTIVVNAIKGEQCALSIVSHGSISGKVFNNRMIGMSWDIEIAETGNWDVHNNYMTGTLKRFLSIGSQYETCQIRNNHMESEIAAIVVNTLGAISNPTEIHHNFINGTIFQQYDGITDIHDNTIVKDLNITSIVTNEPMYMAHDTRVVNNKIYVKNIRDGRGALRFGSSITSATLCYDNLLYSEDDTLPRAYLSGTPDYSNNGEPIGFDGMFPTSLEGAGLTHPIVHKGIDLFDTYPKLTVDADTLQIKI